MRNTRKVRGGKIIDEREKELRLAELNSASCKDIQRDKLPWGLNASLEARNLLSYSLLIYDRIKGTFLCSAHHIANTITTCRKLQ